MNETGFVVLVNLSDDDVSVNSSVFSGVPATGTVRIRSVNFKAQNVAVG